MNFASRIHFCGEIFRFVYKLKVGSGNGRDFSSSLGNFLLQQNSWIFVLPGCYISQNLANKNYLLNSFKTKISLQFLYEAIGQLNMKLFRDPLLLLNALINLFNQFY